MNTKTKGEYITISKSLSRLLRHKASDYDIEMDSSGFVKLSDILCLKSFQKLKVSETDVFNIVKNDNKQRFKIENIADNVYIRCNQGHSGNVAKTIDDDSLLTVIKEPYLLCLHGTYKENKESIEKNGLSVMSRKHVHMASNYNAKSGFRYDINMIIHIDMKSAMNDGYIFYLSDNGVILSSGKNGVIEPKYLIKFELI